MAFIPAAFCSKTVLKGTFIGETIIQTIWGYWGTSFGATLLDNLNTALETWYKTDILPQLSTSYTLTEITSTDMSSANGTSRTRLVTTGNAGQVASGDDMPGNVALCVTFNTGNRGRSYRGRCYLGGFRTGSKGSDGNQILASAAATIAVAFGTDLENVFDGMTPIGDHVVVSHYANKQPRVAAVQTPVTSVAVNVFWDSQRRRLRGRGK